MSVKITYSKKSTVKYSNNLIIFSDDKFGLNKIKKFKLIDSLIIHRYGKLSVNDKIVLVICFSVNRKNSFEATKFIMDYLKKDAPFWKKETYDFGSNWM